MGREGIDIREDEGRGRHQRLNPWIALSGGHQRHGQWIRSRLRSYMSIEHRYGG
ncbi:uncharacterized protein CANTADRAFT_26639 [Suhomyces tanzawaensis NRRL Y-17324]|uniref:Uncharacterized protein n=1 Tax=Suhomyces tanzawaensis NRRL Y-17324 TaxID=984487 RepID=A0A1E4SGR2_9ASCO|nr:uncharacterized protein CANTADRAFT_26639 [Suhomyces tanzawaensis NRRL Y-17324]ODV78602.1 hypothetical protein CANTADRAFT_26639 [Suhomyces tanzawaensis NRRL Y-17324]